MAYDPVNDAMSMIFGNSAPAKTERPMNPPEKTSQTIPDVPELSQRKYEELPPIEERRQTAAPVKGTYKKQTISKGGRIKVGIYLTPELDHYLDYLVYETGETKSGLIEKAIRKGLTIKES